MKMKNKVLAVLLLAFLMINMLPVTRAEAAVSDVWATVNGVDMPDIRSFDWSNYTDWFAEGYGYEGNIGEKIIREHKYCIIMASPGAVDAGYTGYLKFLFTNEPVQYTEHEYFLLFADWTTDVYFELENGRVSTMKGYGQNRYYVGNGVYDDLIRAPIYSDNQSCCVWCANYDFAEAYPNDSRFDYYYIDYPEPEEPEPVTLPVFEPGYEYWLYIYRNESTESIFFANDPFTVAAAEQEGEYTVTLPAGVKVYPVSGYGPYFGREYASGGHVTVKPGDVIRSSHDIQFGDSLVEAWTSGSVSYVPEANSVKYTGELPYVSAFTNYSSGGRAGFDGTKTTYWNCSIEVEGTMPEEAALTKFIVEGKYLMPTRAYFDMCREKDIEPDYLEWKDMYYKTAILKEAYYDDYYTIIDYRDEVDYNERLICLETSNYILEMKESGALFEIYKTDVGTIHSETYIVENFVYKPFLEKIKSFMTPLEVRVTAKCVVDMDVCYGKTYTTQMFHHIAPEFPDINAIVENYYELENREEVVKESLVGALQTQTSEHYQNLLADMQQKLNDAEIKISTLEQTLAVGDEGDLFATFSSVANGLSGLSGSFRNISAAVGNVFAFFPEEITGLLFGGFVVCILIAVYKALRG